MTAGLVFDKWDDLDPSRFGKKIVGAINSNAGILLGSLLGARLDCLGDQEIRISAPQYLLGEAQAFLVSDILIANASAPPDDAQAGNFFDAPDASGFALLNQSLPSPSGLNAVSALSWLDTPDRCLSISRDFVVPGKIMTSTSLCLNLYQASGSPVTVDIYVFGRAWPPVSNF
jgi:hypothetical protein